MKTALAILVLGTACLAPSARQYYLELYKAGALDRMADGYVCFDNDKDLETFFIFGESKYIRQMLIDDGSFAKLPKKDRDDLNRSFVIIRGYDKGVSVGDEDFYYKDGSSWVGEPFVLSKQPKNFGRLRSNITWETLRYKRTVEILNADMSFNHEVSHYGLCEQVSPEVRQHGGP